MISGVTRERFPAMAVGLGLLGLFPFAVALYLQLAVAASPRLSIIHGALVLAFLGGTRWGVSIISGSRHPNLDLTGGAVAVLVGLAAALSPDIPGLCLLIAGLLTLALWDELSAVDGRLPRWFGKFRMLLTAGAVSVLTLLLVFLLI